MTLKHTEIRTKFIKCTSIILIFGLIIFSSAVFAQAHYDCSSSKHNIIYQTEWPFYRCEAKI